MTAAFWPWLLLGAMCIAVGIHHLVFAAEYQAQADERRLSRLSFGSRYDARWWQGARGTGFVFIGMGVFWILINIGARQPMDPAILKWMGALLILVGMWELFAEQHASEWLRRLQQRRSAARLARGSDDYLEERRSLEAHSPTRSKSARQSSGALTIVFGASLLALSITI